jgi:hypothetical protein
MDKDEPKIYLRSGNGKAVSANSSFSIHSAIEQQPADDLSVDPGSGFSAVRDRSLQTTGKVSCARFD